jgi:hypothetical protein
MTTALEDVRSRAAQLVTGELVARLTRGLPGGGGRTACHSPLTGARSWSDLPVQAQRYVKRIEELLGVPVGLIGVGENRGDTIFTDRCPDYLRPLAVRSTMML